MTLLALKQYLQQVRIASLASISVYFDADPDTLRCMLTHWVRKGAVRKCAKTAACGVICGKCAFASTEIYEWVVS